MSFCSNCGSTLDDGDVFCASCGSTVTALAAEATPAPMVDVRSEEVPPAVVQPKVSKTPMGMLIAVALGALILLVVGGWFGFRALSSRSTPAAAPAQAEVESGTPQEQAAILLGEELAAAVKGVSSWDIDETGTMSLSMVEVRNSNVDGGNVARAADQAAQAVPKDASGAKAAEMLSDCAQQLETYNSALDGLDSKTAASSLSAAKYYLWGANQLLSRDPKRIAAVTAFEEKAASLPDGEDMWFLAAEDGGEAVFDKNVAANSGGYSVAWTYDDSRFVAGAPVVAEDMDVRGTDDGMSQAFAGAGIVAFLSNGNDSGGFVFFDPSNTRDDGTLESLKGYSFYVDSTPPLGTDDWSTIMDKSLVRLPHPSGKVPNQ